VAEANPRPSTRKYRIHPFRRLPHRGRSQHGCRHQHGHQSLLRRQSPLRGRQPHHSPRQPTPTPRPTPTPTPTLSDLDCADVASEYIKWSRTNLSADERVTDITLVKEISRGPLLIECKGILHRASHDTYPRKFIRSSRGGISFEKLPVSEYECSFLVDGIITLSEKRSEYTTRRYLLKIYEPTEVSNTEERFACQALGKMSQGGDVRIEFFLEKDRDGDQFIGYRALGQ